LSWTLQLSSGMAVPLGRHLARGKAANRGGLPPKRERDRHEPVGEDTYVVCRSLVLGACAQIQVFSPTDGHGQPPTPTGAVQGLNVLLTGTDSVKLVFVPGVSDHCRGYALGDEERGDDTAETRDERSEVQAKAWLNNDALSVLGMALVKRFLAGLGNQGWRNPGWSLWGIS